MDLCSDKSHHVIHYTKWSIGLRGLRDRGDEVEADVGADVLTRCRLHELERLVAVTY